ncbi:hypothetical protein Q7C_2595 [Methylophaga frappieri]|uniref:Transmembrane protein n=1 Tax=Methylophaga frappieri (strain ATCC BAA-2434 / DSM 25690 / JAM7) TaxID=754477 RepID=I1YLC3_METFJ|nr:hypothetical protein [Methylophaga frappieri]AFJ03716.1 hypothetical protein Q7C_2595 [Methylophaga frappieri]
MQKGLKKQLLKFFKFLLVGLLLIIVLILTGEQLNVVEIMILGITPYLLYLIYMAVNRSILRKK